VGCVYMHTSGYAMLELHRKWDVVRIGTITTRPPRSKGGEGVDFRHEDFEGGTDTPSHFSKKRVCRELQGVCRECFSTTPCRPTTRNLSKKTPSAGSAGVFSPPGRN
jgi:hypothetical protein